MTATRALAVAEAHMHDLSRRRAALAFLVALPLVFYAAGAGHQGAHAVSNGTIATAFSVVGAGIFTELAARPVDPRLLLAGYRPGELLTGRILILAAGSAPILVGTAGLMTVVSHPDRPWLLVLAMLAVGVVGVPLGLVIGLVMPRDLEAVLLLIGIVGVQLSLDSSQRLNLLLPFGGPRRLVEAAVGVRSFGISGIVLTVAYGTALLVIARIVAGRRAPRRVAVSEER